MEIAELRGLVKIDLGRAEADLAGVERRLQETSRVTENTANAADKLSSRAAAMSAALRDAEQGLGQVKNGLEQTGQATAKNVLEISRLETRLSLINSRLDENQAKFSQGAISSKEYGATLTRLSKEAVQVTNDLRRMNAAASDSSATDAAKRAAQAKADAAREMARAYKEAAKAQAEAAREAGAAAKREAREQEDTIVKALKAQADGANESKKLIEQVASELGLTTDPVEGFTEAILAATAATLGLTGVIVAASTKIGIDFQGALNQLSVAADANATQMELARRKAVELGNDLSLPTTSAVDAAKVMLELAKGGLTLAQAMQAAKGTLQLAAAAQIEGAQAAEIQSDALNTFSLNASEAGRVADILANTANASSGDIGDFAQALQQVGGQAAALNIPIEDVATALAIFAKNGLKGSDAGTSFKVMLSLLNPSSKEAAATMKELGLSAFDASGKFKGIRQLAEDLQKSLSGLSEQARTDALNKIFGSDASRSAFFLSKEGAAIFDDLSVKINKVGGSSKTAEAQMKGLGGAIAAIKSQSETAGIAIFDSFSGPMERTVRYVSSLFDKISDGFSGSSNLGRDLRAEVYDLANGFESLSKTTVKAFDLDNPKQMQATLKDLAQEVRLLLDLTSGLTKTIGYFKDISDWISNASREGNKIAHGFEAMVSPVQAIVRAWKDVERQMADLGNKINLMKGGFESLISPVHAVLDLWQEIKRQAQDANVEKSWLGQIYDKSQKQKQEQMLEAYRQAGLVQTPSGEWVKPDPNAPPVDLSGSIRQRPIDTRRSFGGVGGITAADRDAFNKGLAPPPPPEDPAKSKRVLAVGEKAKKDANEAEEAYTSLHNSLIRDLAKATIATRENELAVRLAEDAYKGLSEAQKESLLNLARQIDAQKGIAPLAKAKAEAEAIVAERDQFDFENQQEEARAKNERALQEGISTLEQYYQQKRNLDQADYNRSVDLLLKRQALAESAVSEAQKMGAPASKIQELENEVARLKLEIEKNKKNFEQTSEQNRKADAESVAQLTQQYRALQVELLALDGDPLKAEIYAINEQFAKLLETIKGIPGAGAVINALRLGRIRQATTDDQLRQDGLTNQGFETERQRIQNDLALGVINRAESQRELNNLVRQQRQFLLQAAEAALKLAETEKDPARRQAIIDQVEAYRQQASQLRTLGEQAAMEFRNSFQEYTKDLFKNLLTGNWREGIAGFFQSIADDLLDRASSMFSDLVTNLLWGEDGQSGLLGGLLKSFTDFISKIFSNWFGGFFADGGDFEGGKPIVVGERGPEVIVPSRAGTVVSNEDVRRAVGEGGSQRVVYFNNYQTIDGRRPLSRESRRQVESGIQQGLERAARAD